MTAQIVLVGRPNVGKSTLFNRLTGSRDALVADVPGLTRDRRYGRAQFGGKPCALIDTGGLGADGEFADLIGEQADMALADAHCALFLVDARAGLTAGDQAIAEQLRRSGKRIVLVINKIDGLDAEAAGSEFARLGFADTFRIAANHGRGVAALTAFLARLLPEEGPAAPETAPQAMRTAIVGRPNVGKSTLVNQLLGERRQIVLDRPGTTRDAIEIPYQRRGERFLLIDTAGVRRKGRVAGIVEKFSVVKALDAMERAHVVVLVLDGEEGVVDQDLHVLKLAADAGAGLVVAVNKWDALGGDERRRRRAALDRRLDFIPWAPLRCISALRGQGIGRLMDEAAAVFRRGRFAVSTAALNRALGGLVGEHPPPSKHGRPIKLRYAHKLGEHPPRIGIHGSQAEALPASYVRYLENGFREAFDLLGNPVRLVLRNGGNPYAERANVLSPRQQRQRARLVRHRKLRERKTRNRKARI